VKEKEGKLLHIFTPYGKQYVVDGEGRINGSDAWRLVGLFPTHPFVRNWAHLIPFEDLTPEKIKGLQFRYKNGNPRYTVIDVDHGTVRQWGNTRHHGVHSMWYMDA